MALGRPTVEDGPPVGRAHYLVTLDDDCDDDCDDGDEDEDGA